MWRPGQQSAPSYQDGSHADPHINVHATANQQSSHTANTDSGTNSAPCTHRSPDADLYAYRHANHDACRHPSSIAHPENGRLRSPLLVDSGAGRLYMSATIDRVQRVVALAATDGHVLTTYAIAGTFAVDGVHGWLYVDRDETGLTVLDVRTGVPHTSIALPSHKNERQEDNPAPQADPAAGQVLAFRDNVVYVADPETGAVTHTIPFDIPRSDIDCRLPAGPLPIEWATYDSARRILYLDFETYRCTPWIGHTLLSYDMTSGAEITRGGVPPQFSATAFDGYLYGSSWFRMGDGHRWAWRDGQPWFESSDWSYGAPAFAVDPTRQRLYGQDVGGLHVFDTRTMTLIMIAPLPIAGQLVGYDPKTDQLYFLSKEDCSAGRPTPSVPPRRSRSAYLSRPRQRSAHWLSRRPGPRTRPCLASGTPRTLWGPAGSSVGSAAHSS